jgi:hypothetical protein
MNGNPFDNMVAVYMWVWKKILPRRRHWNNVCGGGGEAGNLKLKKMKILFYRSLLLVAV